MRVSPSVNYVQRRITELEKLDKLFADAMNFEVRPSTVLRDVTDAWNNYCQKNWLEMQREDARRDAQVASLMSKFVGNEGRI